VSQPLDTVREELLRAGVPPRVARRYVMELLEHLDDLTESGRRSGLSATSARERAHVLLGTDDQLTQAMIVRAPRALAVRAPWAVFGLLPLVSLIFIIVVIDASMFRLLRPVHAGWPDGVPNTYTGIIAIASFVSSYLLGPTIASVCILIALRQRLSSPWVWIGLALIAIVSNLLGFHMSVLPPLGDKPGSAIFSAVAYVWMDGRVSEVATWGFMALRATLLFTLAALTFRSLRSHVIRELSEAARPVR
jgi:hypothetical protein